MTIAELQKIEQNAKELKIKNVELEKENQCVFNENLALTKRNAGIRLDIQSLNDKKKVLLQDINGLEKDKASQLTEISSQMAVLNDKKTELGVITLKNQEALDKIDEENALLLRKKADFKAEVIDVEKRKQELIASRELSEEKIKECQALSQEKEKEIAVIKEKTVLIEQEHVQLKALSAKIKANLEDIDNKKAVMQEKIDELKAQKSALVSKACEIDSEKEKIAALKEELKSAINNAAAQEKSYLNLQSALTVDKDRVKIRELRVAEAENRADIKRELESMSGNA